MSTTEAATELNLSDRQIRRLINAGRIRAERVGRQFAVYERQVFTYKRTQQRGRKWLAGTREAALNLLGGTSTRDLSASERSRLKRRIRESSNSFLAMQLLSEKAHLYVNTGAAEHASDAFHRELGLVGSLTQVIVTQDLRRDLLRKGFAPNPNGNIVAIDGAEEHEHVLFALALYTYGDDRERTAAGAWLEKKKSEL